LRTWNSKHFSFVNQRYDEVMYKFEMFAARRNFMLDKVKKLNKKIDEIIKSKNRK